MTANTSLLTRTAGLRLALLVFVLLVPAACTEVTGVARQGDDSTPTPTAQPLSGGDVYFSFASGDDDELMSSVASSGTDGPRWCTQLGSWIDPSARRCAGNRSQPPFGEVTFVPEGLRVAAGNVLVAPFVWSAGPDRPDPFPAEGDFVLDVGMTFEQVGAKGLGLQVSRWVPARTDGGYTPSAAQPVLRILADGASQLGVILLGGQRISVENPLGPHAYQVVYKGGEYTLFVDGELAAGPVASALRPNAFWIGSPQITWWSGDWSDLLLSELTVSVIDQVEVPFAIKPGACPAPVNRKARGVLPAAIMGTADVAVSEIDPATILLEGEIAPLRHSYEDVGTPSEPYTGRTVEDCNAAGPDGLTDLTLKFDNAAVAALLADAEEGDEHTLTLSGKLKDGTPIAGESIVVVIK
ncbi:MAG TPA: hypothetical protein VMM12_12630 [Longimicrobiales bacterium]|nr:hypothetical protein [Longimicrobiales bacterium]